MLITWSEASAVLLQESQFLKADRNFSSVLFMVRYSNKKVSECTSVQQLVRAP